MTWTTMLMIIMQRKNDATIFKKIGIHSLTDILWLGLFFKSYMNIVIGILIIKYKYRQPKKQKTFPYQELLYHGMTKSLENFKKHLYVGLLIYCNFFIEKERKVDTYWEHCLVTHEKFFEFICNDSIPNIYTI